MHKHQWLIAAAERSGAQALRPIDLDTADLERCWELVAAGFGLDQAELAERVAGAYGLGTLGKATPEESALALVPARWAMDSSALPLEVDDEQVVVAVADPHDLDLRDELSFITGRTTVFVVAPPADLMGALRAHYRTDEATADIAAGLREGEAHVHETSKIGSFYDVSAADIEGGPVVKLANRILADAIRGRASDVHLGFGDGQGLARYRVDGILHNVMEIPAPVMLRVISRIKVISGLDVGDKLRPQDGRCRVRVDDKTYDLRVSTVPTRGTEKAVLRILDPSSAPSLEGISMRSHELGAFERLLQHREGIVIVTGPTGSGKTTTLYAALARLSTEEVNIMTVEDPVEYELPDLTQIQVNPRQGVTFASALRAVLRQDPDIVLVGEIRDLETAEIAVQAGMTGHLVLATLHTNDAIGAIRRMADLGLDRPSIADSLRGIVAQRLVRRLCDRCVGSPDEKLDPDCEQCAGAGYAGRAPVNEVVPITAELQELIVAAAPAAQLQRAAVRAGARSMRSSGEEAVAQRVTSLEELERVLGVEPGWDAGVEAPAELTESLPSAPTEPESAPSEPGNPEPTPLEPRLEATDRLISADGACPRILVAEDDKVARMVIKRTLTKRGYEVVDVAEGLEAVRLLRSDDRFDLLITDLDMPEMSGRALVDQVRLLECGKGLRVIVFTGSSDAESEARLLASGADDYLRKPVRPALFLARVEAALRRPPQAA